MTIKKYISGDEARTKLFNGMKHVADAVGSTAGPSGRTIAIQQPWGATKVTKDGITVAKAFSLSGAEGEGAKLIIQASEKTGKDAGDGTTNTCIIAKTIAEEGLRYINKGCKSTQLKKGIDDAVKDLVGVIKTHSKEITTNEEIKQLATISANGDEEIGGMIAEAIEKVGKHGVVTVEEAKGLKTELEFVEGLQIGQGYLSPYFMTNLEKQLVEFDNPMIFLYDGKVNSLKSILPLLEEVSQTGRPLVMIVDEIDDSALGALIQNHLKGTLKSCVVKAPSFGDIRKSVMEDIAILTGGQFVSSILGNDLEKLGVSVLGSCGKIKISPNETVIINGMGDNDTIEERVAQIKGEIENSQSAYDKEKLRERLARLVSGVAVIRVGAATEVELNEIKDRVDDAVCATRAALEEGILPGGGISLIKAVKELDRIKGDSDYDAGYGIVIRAIESQLKIIAENSGKSGEVVIEKVKENQDFNFGYDASKDEYCDLMERGIIDATKVVRCALENGSSVAGSLLTVEGLIIDDIEENKRLNDHMKSMAM
jgi:chaperonin GroEL